MDRWTESPMIHDLSEFEGKATIPINANMAAISGIVHINKSVVFFITATCNGALIPSGKN